MNRILFISCGLLVLLSIACQPKGWEKIISIPTILPEHTFQVPENLPSVNSWESYVADDEHLDHLPVKNLRVIFQYMNSSDSTKNYNYDKAKGYTYLMVKAANEKLAENKKSHLPLHNDIPVLKTRYRYKRTNATVDNVTANSFVHYDDELYYYVKEGKNRNIGDRRVLKKYGIGMDSIINVFMMPHHPDSLKSKTYSGGLTGVALGFHTKIATTSTTELDAWKNTSNFNHELGHILGLPHSWGNDGCDDTAVHNNKCWNFTTNGSVCDSMVSNNMMSYNISQRSITPCQIGKIHKQLSRIDSKLRNYVIKDWCNYDPANPILIKEEIYWTGDKDLPTDIIIMDGGSLYISSRIAMAPRSKIMVQSGGRLILDGARLHSDCNEDWKGIWKDQKGKAEVIFMNDPKLEDVGAAAAQAAAARKVIPKS